MNLHHGSLLVTQDQSFESDAHDLRFSKQMMGHQLKRSQNIRRLSLENNHYMTDIFKMNSQSQIL